MQAQTVATRETRQLTSGHTTEPINGPTSTQNSTAAQAEAAQTPGKNHEWAVIEDQTQGTSEADKALLADEQMAVIEPGGQLALDFRAGQFFGNGPQADLQILGLAQEQVSYLVFVRNDPAAAWQRIDVNRKPLPNGVAAHDMGHHGIQQARQVLIRNLAPRALHIDAVSVFYQNIAGSEPRRSTAPHANLGLAAKPQHSQKVARRTEKSQAEDDSRPSKRLQLGSAFLPSQKTKLSARDNEVCHRH